MPTYAYITQDDFVAAIRHLAARLTETGAAPDFIVGIGRGGLVPAVYLSHATGVPMLSIDYSSAVDDFAAALLIRLAERTRAGERLLFLDDINDSGRTIAQIRAALHAASAIAARLRFATLIDNSRSAERVDCAARTIDRQVTKDWFVFPWEAIASDASIADDAAAVPDRIA